MSLTTYINPKDLEQQVADTFAAQTEFLSANIQRKAVENFLAAGIPTSKKEAWKYTNLPTFLKNSEIQVQGTAADANIQELIQQNRVENTKLVVLVNGIFQPEFSEIPTDLTVTSLKNTPQAILERYYDELTPAQDGLSNLNTALANDGLFIHLKKDQKFDDALQIIHLSTLEKGIMNARYLCLADENSALNIVETRISGGKNGALNNFVSEVFVDKNAHLAWTLVQQESDEALQVNHLYSHQSDQSILDTFTAVLGGKMVRNSLNYLPDAEFCQTHLNGVVIGRGNTHADNHTFVNHAQPNCESNESFKHILADKSTGVFNGKIYVAQDAQKTNAYQSNKTILLGSEAKVFAKPELEIYADDVKCSHGAACGQLDEDAMFYLMARGIEKDNAQKLLLTAFATDVLELIHNEMIQQYVTAQIIKRLG